MKLLFDSDVLIRSLNGSATAQATALLDEEHDSAISIITRIEVLAGVFGSSEVGGRHYLSTFVELPFTSEVAQQTIRLRRESRLKLPDAIIYATALETGRMLVTYNTRDFRPNMPSVLIPA